MKRELALALIVITFSTSCSTSSRTPSSSGEAGENLTTHNPSQDQVLGLEPDGKLALQRPALPPLRELKVPVLRFALKKVATDDDAVSRMTRTDQPGNQFRQHLQDELAFAKQQAERVKRQGELELEIKKQVALLNHDLKKMKEEEVTAVQKTLAFLEKRMAKLTYDIEDVVLVGDALVRLDEISQKKLELPESLADDNALQKDYTRLHAELNYYRWRAQNTHELFEAIEKDHGERRQHQKSTFAVYLASKLMGPKADSEFSPYEPLKLKIFNEYASKVIQDPDNFPSERARHYLNWLFTKSVEGFSNNPSHIRRQKLASAKELWTQWSKDQVIPSVLSSRMLEGLEYLGEFVQIPAGEFQMGSPKEEKERAGDESQHQVALSPFEVQVASVTQEAYARVMGDNPSRFKESKYCPHSYDPDLEVQGHKIPVCRDFPVENVSWEDAEKFVNKLSDQVRAKGYAFSLPSEAQQEYMIRGGTTTAYVSGENAKDLGEYVWYSDNSGSQTHAVRSKTPNAYGIYRSSVWEWGNDWYVSSYATQQTSDPTGPSSGSDRVFRGCSWNGAAGYCRSAQRFNSSPGDRNSFLGFRLLRTH